MAARSGQAASRSGDRAQMGERRLACRRFGERVLRHGIARRDLLDWLEGGAYFYVCGDAKGMAKDVRATLIRAFADVKAISPEAAERCVAAIERERRYLQDTY